MKREIFSDEHDLFRAQLRRFAEEEIEPKVAGWNEKGTTDLEIWRRCGEAGYLGANAPEEYGGAGADFLFDAIIMEELSRIRAHALMISLHSDICMPYLTRFGSKAQKEKYLPGTISGDSVLVNRFRHSLSVRSILVRSGAPWRVISGWVSIRWPTSVPR